MTTRRALVGAALIAGLVLTGCGGTPEAPTPPGKSSMAGGTPTPAPTPTPRPVTLAFGGDVHFEGAIADRLATDPDTALGPVRSVLKRADLAVVNLETAITTRGDPAPKAYTFRAPPSAFRALRSAGVDVVTMANNHGMDYGDVGLRDSLAAAKKRDFPVVGVGRNADEAYAPHLVTINDQRIAVIGATQVLDDNLISAWTAGPGKPGLASAKEVPRLIRAVRETRPEVDTLVVFLHWGLELQSCPLPRQQMLARKLVDAGADVIVGGHAHVVGPGGYLDGAYVHYGLGNFVFYSGSGRTAESGVLELTVNSGKILRSAWKPAVLSGGVPHTLDGAAAAEARSAWNSMRDCTNLRARP